MWDIRVIAYRTRKSEILGWQGGGLSTSPENETLSPEPSNPQALNRPNQPETKYHKGTIKVQVLNNRKLHSQPSFWAHGPLGFRV